MEQTKLKVICEVISVIIILRLIIWLLPLTNVYYILDDIFYWNYLSHILFLIVPILIIGICKRDFKLYGLHLKTIKIDLIFFSLLIIGILSPPLIAVILNILQFNFEKYPQQYLFSTFFFQIVVTGFTEEILYRGYYQSRLNDAFKKPYHLENFNFGPSVIIVAILFGLAHVLNPFNPIRGQFSLNFIAGIFTTLIGLILGFVREKTESIFAPSLIHGVYNGFIVYLSGDYSDIFITIGWSIAYIMFFFWLFRLESKELDNFHEILLEKTINIQ